jgi:hypothetical protein
MDFSFRFGAVTAMISYSSEHRPRPSASHGAALNSPHEGRSRPACPRCNASAIRIPRRFIDRVISVVHPVHRYRCHSFICSWEGNLPSTALVSDRGNALAATVLNRAPANSIAPDESS